MERKRTHFKMYKIGRRWAFACAVILTLGGTTLAARADGTATSSAESTSSSSVVESGSDSSTLSPSNASAESKIESGGNQTGTTTASSTSESSSDSNQAPTDKSGSVSDADDSSNASSTNTQSTTNASGTNNTNDINNTNDTSDVTGATDSKSNQQQTPVATSLKLAAPAATSTQDPASGSASDTNTGASTTSATKTENSAVSDGGTVEEDYPDLHNMLGVSSQFHIFAREAELNAHTNGNIAVGTLSGNVNFGTNIIEELLDKDISYIQNINKIASSSFVSAGDTRSNKVIFGENVDIDVSNPNRPKVNGIDIDHLLASEVYQDKNGNVYIDFDKEFAKLEQLSGSLSKQNPHVNYTSNDFEDMNNRVIDVSDLQPDENGHIIVNLSADVLATSTPLTIKGLSADKDGNTVIINVDTAGNQDYHVNSQIKVIYDDGTDRNNQETEDFGDNHLLWNFYDATASDQLASGVISIDRPFQGSVLAPKAEVVANQNVDGNIIANKVVVNAETHRWDLQDNVDNEKDPDPDPAEFEKPVHPTITIPGLPEEPEPETPGETEEPEPETPEEPEPETPGETEEPE
ncbi:choice-of-anchor A family protein, partial [Lactiplantibacillus garii]